jgi:hypothetical protein
MKQEQEELKLKRKARGLVSDWLDRDNETLPKIDELPKLIRGYHSTYITEAFHLRNEYTNHMFLVLSHELIVSMQSLCKRLGVSKVSELMCGTGHLSYWFNKYGPLKLVDSVDDCSWEKFNNWPDWITKRDAVEYVEQSPDIELYIMSWPYMDDNAVNIWRAMKPGQYLLYFGEDRMGCTANDAFFDETDAHEVDCYSIPEFEGNTVRFDMIHDYPHLYKKASP